jgi:transcriptional regulator with XRE-family HTH domain
MEKSERKHLGGKIKQVRVSLGMSQSELAVASKINMRTIARVEAGESIPGHKTAVRLARALGISLMEIEGGQTELSPKSPLRQTQRAEPSQQEKTSLVNEKNLISLLQSLALSSPQTEFEAMALQCFRYFLNEPGKLWLLYALSPNGSREMYREQLIHLLGREPSTDQLQTVAEMRDLLFGK